MVNTGVYGDYRNDVDENILEVVRVLNEDLGLKTYASCDGNHSSYEKKNKSGDIIVKFPQSSYIAMDCDTDKFLKLENYCKLHGFKKCLENQDRFEHNVNYYKNFNSGRFEFHFSQFKNRMDGKKFSIYIHPYKATSDNLKMTTIKGKNYLGVCDYETLLDLKIWNKIRNRGWRIALNIIKTGLE